MAENENIWDKWDNFIKELEKKHDEEHNDFYLEVRDYFDAIKAVSCITADDIDDQNKKDETRNKIESNIETIVDFLNSHKDYYELANIKGFKKSEKKIKGRDYYFYIADQQMKATVYYARYLNFINECKTLSDKDKKDVNDKIDQYSKLLGIKNEENEKNGKKEDVPEKCSNIITVIEEKIYFNDIKKLRELVLVYKKPFDSNEEIDEEKLNDSLKNIQNELLRYAEEWKIANDLNYKIYMMLNNMLREIRFFGAAFQYLWHWNKHKKNLYRSGTMEKQEEEEPINSVSPKKEKLSKMFKDCIGHMNQPSEKRHTFSFSENLLLDIYKYLVLKKPEKETNINLDNGLSMSCTIENDKKEYFYIIKNASVNSIYLVDGTEDISFYDYAIKEGDSDIAGYLVELFPQQGFEGEKNSKGTVKGMRDSFLPAYFDSWDIDVHAQFSKTKVADDKEVITYGKCYDKQEDFDENIDFEQSDDGTLFKMELTKNDILRLLLNIYTKRKKKDSPEEAAEEIARKIGDRMYDKYTQNWKKFSSFFGEGTDEEWQENFRIGCVRENEFEIKIKADSDYKNYISSKVLTKEQGQSSDIDKADVMIGEIKSKIESYFKKRYSEDIKNSKKADFIIKTLSDEELNFNLISHYSEYMPDQEDSEITMLKRIIFKEA